MTDSLAIREARQDDLEPLTQFLAPFVGRQQILPRSPNELSILLKNGFVAECNSVIVGFAAVEVYSQKLAEVQCLCVADSYQGQGLGRKLVSLCVTRAIELDVCELMAITAVESLFMDCGFHYSLPGQKRALFVETKKRS
ncbi:MAG: GNAT family N-acetyltransferase [Planctomycetales bacterium]|nr:GNAT family N-acetyltransferase [Planctomycetales bacterium]